MASRLQTTPVIEQISDLEDESEEDSISANEMAPSSNRSGKTPSCLISCLSGCLKSKPKTRRQPPKELTRRTALTLKWLDKHPSVSDREHESLSQAMGDCLDIASEQESTPESSHQSQEIDDNTFRKEMCTAVNEKEPVVLENMAVFTEESLNLPQSANEEIETNTVTTKTSHLKMLTAKLEPSCHQQKKKKKIKDANSHKEMRNDVKGREAVALEDLPVSAEGSRKYFSLSANEEIIHADNTNSLLKISNLDPLRLQSQFNEVLTEMNLRKISNAKDKGLVAAEEQLATRDSVDIESEQGSESKPSRQPQEIEDNDPRKEICNAVKEREAVVLENLPLPVKGSRNLSPSVNEEIIIVNTTNYLPKTLKLEPRRLQSQSNEVIKEINLRENFNADEGLVVAAEKQPAYTEECSNYSSPINKETCSYNQASRCSTDSAKKANDRNEPLEDLLPHNILKHKEHTKYSLKKWKDIDWKSEETETSREYFELDNSQSFESDAVGSDKSETKGVTFHISIDPDQKSYNRPRKNVIFQNSLFSVQTGSPHLSEVTNNVGNYSLPSEDCPEKSISNGS